MCTRTPCVGGKVPVKSDARAGLVWGCWVCVLHETADQWARRSMDGV